MSTRVQKSTTQKPRTKTEYVCAFCKKDIPEFETARTFETPPDRGQLPAGSGWVICGPDCPKLPKGAEVFYRKPVGK
jgi:hypothetical protein